MVKVLIIDPDRDFCSRVFEVLKLAGYGVLKSHTGKDGVAAGLEHSPDIILCDNHLEDLDGYGILQLLKSNEKTRAIPFVFTSIKAGIIDLRRAMDLGADDYLVKPFSDSQLLRTIDARLQKKQFYKDHFGHSENNNNHNGHASNGFEFGVFLEDRKVRTLKKGQSIFYEGDPCSVVWIILEGTVKTTKMAEDGRELITGIFHQDDFMGINSLFTNEGYCDTATAITDCKLITISRQHFEALIFQHPEVAQKTIRLLSAQLRQQEEQLMQIAYQSVRKRISEAILRLYKVQESAQIQITRVDLAALSATAPETVSRILTDFKNEGLIEKNGNELTILGVKKLERLKN